MVTARSATSLDGLVGYEDQHGLRYMRGPAGIVVALAEKLL
jgi:hypothetical protein